MNKSYVIQWKSTVNGRAGRGTKRFGREDAKRLVEELNLEYPQILHEMVSADSERHSEGDERIERPEFVNREEHELVASA